MLTIAEAAGHVLDRLHPAVETLAHAVGRSMLVTGQDVVDVSTDGVCCLADWFQSTVGRPEAPPSFSTNPTAHFINGPNYAVGPPVGPQREVSQE